MCLLIIIITKSEVKSIRLINMWTQPMSTAITQSSAMDNFFSGSILKDAEVLLSEVRDLVK